MTYNMAVRSEGTMGAMPLLEINKTVENDSGDRFGVTFSSLRSK